MNKNLKIDERFEVILVDGAGVQRTMYVYAASGNIKLVVKMAETANPGAKVTYINGEALDEIKRGMKPARLTKAEKLAQKAAEHQFAEQKFNETRDAIWTALFYKAMRLELMTHHEDDMRETNSCWFYEFCVDAELETLTTGDGTVSKETLTLDSVTEYNAALDHAFDLRKQYYDKMAELRKAEEEWAAARAVALAKLTDQERMLLGVK